MSTLNETELRANILERFQGISGLNTEDCISLLHQYHWKLDEIVEDFLRKKDFAKNSNQKKEFQPQLIHNPQNNRPAPPPLPQQPRRPAENNDRYVAELLARYGDADESARRQWREREQNSRLQQTSRPQELPSQSSKENTNTGSIIHEKQKYLRCGVHSLNNLFQVAGLFTHEQLDSIAREFDRNHVNNDYATLWIGDYDLRVLIEAITRRGHSVRQINYFTGDPIHTLPWDSYFGLLLNLNSAHWFTIKNINGFYYNLDSTFREPSQIGYRDALVNYLMLLIQQFKSVYIFAVLP